MTLQTPYFAAVAHYLEQVEQTQTEHLQQVAAVLAACFEQNGILHTFGCGHSASTALDAFYRSGCFAGINAIVDPGLMFQSGAKASTAFERLEGYGSIVLARHTLSAQDVLLAISNSGRNPAGIEVVLQAKKQGLKTIAITSLQAQAHSTSRHSSGILLKDAADYVIDNCCPPNETALQINGVDVAPVSTVVATSILHEMLTRAARLLAAKDLQLPVYRSSNAGGDSVNAALIAQYKARIKQLN